MIIDKVIGLAVVAGLASASAAYAQSTFTYGAYLDYDYDREEEDGETTFGTYLDYQFGVGVFVGVEVYTEDSDDDDYGYDLSVGYRGTVDDLSYELGYFDYNLENSGDDGEEVILSLGYNATETLLLSSSLSTDLDGNYGFGQDFGFALPADFGLGIGFDLASDDDDVEWYAELTRDITDSISITAGIDGTSDDEDDTNLYISVGYEGSFTGAY